MMPGYRAASRPYASGDWFERLMGFREEAGYDATQGRLLVEGDELVSTVNGHRYGIGELTLPTLAQLRGRVNPTGQQRSSVGIVVGDVRALHCDSALQGALFQVASQFNLLEMTSQDITPEQGVSRYAYDPTQGPACAIAAGAATIYRNYRVPVGEGIGQTRERQVDALAGLGAALSDAVGMPVSRLWRMQNGYALCSREGLAAITELLSTASADLLDMLRGHLAIGLHRDVEVTDVADGPRRRVSQAFCSALPIAYSQLPRANWELFARLVLEAAYEATLLAAADQASKGGSNTVLLTRLGGGAFGNEDNWIDTAIERALAVVECRGLDIRIVSRGHVTSAVRAIVDRWG
ncbi:hypothetical protein [Mycobacterium asiaticum]|uniref:hypothetical protein n=1 Tax=Mycobacterium asiaticum TaxID=1790 RepID=UPI001F36B401|nr:hypothetical protein [Mycobacterium asiaticum]